MYHSDLRSSVEVYPLKTSDKFTSLSLPNKVIPVHRDRTTQRIIGERGKTEEHIVVELK